MDEVTPFWNSLMKLLHSYDTVIKDDGLKEETRIELKRRLSQIDGDIDRIREKYRVLT
jgi:hypothetical protein